MSRAYRKEAEELWTQFSAVLESTCNDFETLKPLLEKAKQHFQGSPIADYIRDIILKESEAHFIEWDSIRHLLHEEWDNTLPKSDLKKAIELRYSTA